MNLHDLKQNYYQQTFGKEDEILKNIRKLAQQEGIEFMQLNPADAHILQTLTQINQTTKAIEIGGLYGYSTLHIARGLTEKGSITSIDIDQQRQDLSKNTLKKSAYFHKIQWINGDAHQVLPSLQTQSPFDLIFIDADKVGYLDYLYWAERNLKIGGLLIADNTFLFHTLYAKEPKLSELEKKHHVSKKSIQILQSFNSRLVNSTHWKSSMIPTEDGMSIAIKIKEVLSSEK